MDPEMPAVRYLRHTRAAVGDTAATPWVSKPLQLDCKQYTLTCAHVPRLLHFATSHSCCYTHFPMLTAPVATTATQILNNFLTCASVLTLMLSATIHASCHTQSPMLNTLVATTAVQK
jgi:hypothetical protein